MSVQEKTAVAASTTMRQFCTFQVAGRLFGVDILDVKEINDDVDFTPVFHAPPDVKGYVNIRGQIHLVLDLRRMLGFSREESTTDESRRLVIFKPSVGESFAVMVDRIGDILNIDESSLDDIQSGGGPEGKSLEGAHANLMLGVCKLDESLLVVLDARRFLTALI